MGPAAYTEGEQFQRERRTLFAHAWLPFAASAQLAGAGDFVSHSIGGWPLFAIRGDDGVARGFHNVCRHQSMPVVEQTAGSCEVLRCRYHGWSYASTGEFLDAPPRVAPTDLREKLGLNAVELSERDGFCMVRVQPGGTEPPRLQLPERRFATAITTDIDANWKAVVEAILAEEDCQFVWPLAFTAKPESQLGIMHQVVPRSFSRTRIVDLIYGANGPTEDLAACRSRAAAAKAAAESCQRARAGALAPAPSDELAEFLRKVALATGD
jgi:phenylpropionate dioxygenase-like ring-hydroxylating dioxygenase large terminal subunit